MDRRQQKTRQAVFQAFTSLLEKKHYSKITTQEIIENANIGRSTFYSHFDTKDELLKALCTEIFKHVFDDALSRESTHDFSTEPMNLQAEITHMLYHLQDSRHYLRGLLLSESGELFIQHFKCYLVDVFRKNLKDCCLDVPADYMLNHMVCAFAETVRWWMRNGEYAPEEVSRFFFTVSGSFDEGDTVISRGAGKKI